MKKGCMGCLFFFVMPFFLLPFFFFSGGLSDEGLTGDGTAYSYTGEYSEDLPIFKEIKGRGPITDEHAQAAVGAAIKYRLLPSVILSQLGYESAYGQSHSGKSDHNYFGITWFPGSPYPQGSARGIGGSEGGYYMKFPNLNACYAYYGFMVASQTNFNACVGNKDPGQSLLILGRGGYAAAGISEDSAYYKGAMSIIRSYHLTDYDKFAINHWQAVSATHTQAKGKGNAKVLDNYVGQQVGNGQCYALASLYSKLMNGPSLGAGVTGKIDVLPGTDGVSAYQIGNAYDWEKFGWQVINQPKFSDLRPGDIITYRPYSTHSISQWGHVEVIASVEKNNVFHTYGQNTEAGQICAYLERTFDSSVYSLIRKVK